MNTIFKKGLNISNEKLSAFLTFNNLIVQEDKFNSLQLKKNINPFIITFSGFWAVFSGILGT